MYDTAFPSQKPGARRSILLASLGVKAIEGCLEKPGVIGFYLGQTGGVPGVTHCVSPRIPRIAVLKNLGWGGREGLFSYGELSYLRKECVKF